MTMLEKVAKAIYDSSQSRSNLASTEWEYVGLKHFWFDLAQDAIEAMRLSVDDPLMHELNRYADHDVWYWHNEMIDAALNEKA